MKRMQTILKRLVILGLLAHLAATIGVGQQKAKPPQKELSPRELAELEKNARNARNRPPGASFYIAPLEGGRGLFSVMLADANGKSVSGTFTLQQVEVFEAVLEASEAFALTNEKVGTGTPIITRLMEQHEWSLFVDVSKVGDESRLYISLITPMGKLTTDAGEISRSSKKQPQALLWKILSQVREAKADFKAKSMQ